MTAIEYSLSRRKASRRRRRTTRPSPTAVRTEMTAAAITRAETRLKCTATVLRSGMMMVRSLASSSTRPPSTEKPGE